MKIKKLKKLKVAILWFGKEGKSSLSFLLRIHTSHIWIFDDREDTVYELSKFLVDTKKSFDLTIEEYNSWFIGNVIFKTKHHTSKIQFFFWNFQSTDLEKYDRIIKAPGISPLDKKYKKIEDKFTSQTQIFYENYSWKIIGITGTKGKSTISTLTYKALKNAKYKVKLVGNIWTPVLDEIDILSEKKYDFVVYETSSYMLHNFTPKNHISVLNNIYTCHLDWHKTLDNYSQAKLNILKNSKTNLVNFAFWHLATHQKFDTFGTWGTYSFDGKNFVKNGKKIVSGKFVQLAWAHNRENISAVIWVVDKIVKNRKKVSQVMEKTLKSFTWLEHRLEVVGKYKWISFVNDAIAVTPEATLAALESFPQTNTIFLGGIEAGYDFSTLEETILKSKISNIVLFPNAKIFEKISKKLTLDKQETIKISDKQINFLLTKNMQNAVKFAYTHTQKNSVALLSCAAQSFSLWKNFEIKGAEFKKYVKELG